jgi:hypothetical protein
MRPMDYEPALESVFVDGRLVGQIVWIAAGAVRDAIARQEGPPGRGVTVRRLLTFYAPTFLAFAAIAALVVMR